MAFLPGCRLPLMAVGALQRDLTTGIKQAVLTVPLDFGLARIIGIALVVEDK